MFSKTISGKLIAGKHSGLRITVRDDSVHKGPRRRIVLIPGIAWYEIQDQTWRGRRFWTNHPVLSRIHTFSSRPTIQRMCSHSWRHNCRTSHWSSHRENYWQFWTWDRNSITKQSKTDILCSDIQVKESIRGRMAYPRMSNIIAPARNYSLNMQTQKKANFAWRSRRLAQGNLLRPLVQVIPAPGNWMRTLSAFLPAQYTCTQKEPFLRQKGIGKLFLPIHRTGDFNSDLQNGYKIGASLRSRRTTIWCSSSLGHDEAETAESVRKTRSTRFLRRRRLASTHPWRKQQDEVRVLRGFQKFLGFRAIQRHSGGITIVPGLVEHILIPNDWKEFVFHRGCSFSVGGQILFTKSQWPTDTFTTGNFHSTNNHAS